MVREAMSGDRQRYTALLGDVRRPAAIHRFAERCQTAGSDTSLCRYMSVVIWDVEVGGEGCGHGVGLWVGVVCVWGEVPHARTVTTR